MIQVGLSFIFSDYFELGVRYFDAFDVPSAIECKDHSYLCP